MAFAEHLQPPLPTFQLDLNPARRREFVAECNRRLAEARERIVETCRTGSGVEASRKYSADMDAILRSIGDFLLDEARISPANRPGVAVVAQGGYGRRHMCLHSDLDLLFVMPDNPTPTEQAFVKSFLYLLWDLNRLEIGYATKKIGDALAAFGVDLDSSTSLIELRLIHGPEAPVLDIRKRVAHMLRGSTRRWFVESKLAEAAARSEKFGSTVYLLEPNIKDGEGGLRDYHSIQWLVYVLVRSESMNSLVTHDILSAGDLDRMEAAFDFLLRLRTLLHKEEGRKADVLSFHRQPAVAAALGYTSDPETLAEEKLMQDYYLNARMIDRFSQKATRILTAKSQTALGGLVDAVRRRSAGAHYFTRSGVLFLKKPDADYFVTEPRRLFECFRAAMTTGTVVSDEIRELVSASLPRIDQDAFGTDPVNRDNILWMFSQRVRLAAAVHIMHECGLLGFYIPEFQKLFCLVRIDHYHRYTIDEHLIKTVEAGERLAAGDPERYPELIEAAALVKRWDLLTLGLLLHDIGKGLGHGHVLRGAVLSQQITQRMQLPPEDGEVIRQLILQHLRMAHISQRRDLEDPHVIEEMARHVPDPELLTMLYVLTYCDTASVGPGNWTDWKASLLYTLYRKTMLHLTGHPATGHASGPPREKLRAQMLAQQPPPAPEQVEAFLNNASPKYLNLMTVARMVRHLHLLEGLTRENRVAYELHDPPELNYTEIVLVSYDRPGLLSLLCGALSSKELNILSLQAFSTKDGFAIDTFQVTDLRGNRLPAGFRLDRLKNDLNTVLLGTAKFEEVFTLRRRTPTIREDVAVLKPSKVILDNEASPNHTVLEVKAFDRPGLLYDITSVCAEQKYVIHLAMITTEAYRVVDVFYITDLEFNKLEPPQMKRLEKALMDVI